VFVKREARDRARELRRDAMPLKRIAAVLGVSSSSVSRWTRDIELTASQQERLRQLNPRFNAQLRGQAGRSRSARAAREAAQQDGRVRAKTLEPLHVQGCMLYWAEGSKARNVAVLTNSDPDLLRVFTEFLRRCYGVDDGRLALSVNCFLGNGLSLDEIESWWLTRLDLPRSCLRKATVNRPSPASALRRGHVLPYGTARVALCSVHIVQSIYGAIQEYAGIERPEWLD
jgi:hypothetical protein